MASWYLSPPSCRLLRLLAGLILLALALSAGPRKDRQAAVPGPPADATYAGDSACTDCHSEYATQFPLSAHGRLQAAELGAAGGRCESCHGPASRHIAAGGDRNLITSFSAGRAPGSSRACAACHGAEKAMRWKGSEHQMAGIECSSCHTIHQGRVASTPMTRRIAGSRTLPTKAASAPPPRASLKKAEPELCYDCHREKRGQMNRTSHHPVREGRMACSSCHETHGSSSDHLLKPAESEKAFCTGCHPSKHGPFVFEHAAVEEGCSVCHQPHGTVADNLLKQNEPFLCLQCHEAHFHIGREGLTTPVYSNPSGGSSNPNGTAGWRKAFTTKCTQCHTQIHGSDLPSQSITSRGKALTR